MSRNIKSKIGSPFPFSPHDSAVKEWINGKDMIAANSFDIASGWESKTYSITDQCLVFGKSEIGKLKRQFNILKMRNGGSTFRFKYSIRNIQMNAESLNRSIFCFKIKAMR